jgi:hypothetical protein
LVEDVTAIAAMVLAIRKAECGSATHTDF